jgi:predicted nucleic acid-binding protein
MTNDLRAGLDSNCLSYLLGAASNELTADGALFAEGVALIRLWFYIPGRFYITDTVARECAEISSPAKKALHLSFTSHTYWGVPVRDQARVEQRTGELKLLHRGVGDSAALAEAEEANLDVLLTYDKDFLKCKDSFGSTVSLTRPSELWARLAVPRGAMPVVRPTLGNPLETQRWWLWQ